MYLKILSQLVCNYGGRLFKTKSNTAQALSNIIFVFIINIILAYLLFLLLI